MSQLTFNQVDLSQSEAHEKYTVYRYRYMIGFIYILLSNNNILMWYTFSPLQTTLSTIYNQSITYTNFCTILISNVSFIPANFVGNYIIDTFGLRIGMITGGLLSLIGLWARCLSKHGFIWIFIGQMFAGLAQPFFYNTPQKVSNEWFGVNERITTTSVLVTAMNIGATLGTFLPQYFVDIYADQDTILDQIQNMMFWSAILGSASFIFLVIFMREKPPTPPSKAAAAEKYNYLDSLKTLIKDRNAMILLASTGAISGAVINYLSTLQQAVEPFGIDGVQSGNILSIGNIASLFGTVAIATVFNQYKKYNMFLIVISISSFFVLIANLFAAESGNVYLFGTAVLVYNILLTSITPIALEYGVELSFPVGEATVGGFWYVINQLSAFIESLVVDQILEDYPTRGGARVTFYIGIVYQAFAMIPLFFIKENLKRTEYEKQGQLIQKNKVVDSSA